MIFALTSLIGCLDYGDLDQPDDETTTEADGGGGLGDGGGNGGGNLGGAGGDDDDDDDDASGEVDENCAVGVSAFCTCSGAYDYPCTEADMYAFYDQCVAGEDQGLFDCMADFVKDDTIDCYASFSVCLADYQG